MQLMTLLHSIRNTQHCLRLPVIQTKLRYGSSTSSTRARLEGSCILLNQRATVSGLFARKSVFCLQGCRHYSDASRSASEWNATIGLELHVQLTASQKLFSTASARWDDAPNTNINMVDAGLPGALPRLNPQCVELASRAILGLNGHVQPRSSFDRKHYFYSDQPLGYQITQQLYPIGRGGFIELGPADGFEYSKRIRIHQLQLEQDTAKSVHGVHIGHVLTDFNRAGVALIEIVSEPDMDTAAEASCFVRKMQILLRHLGVSNCNMEEGSIRCDVNVSVYPKGGDRLSGTRCELKNLNSLKVIRSAIDAEIARQIGLISTGSTVEQETRGFDARKGETYLARSKEAALDYRYMPDPDIPAVCISEGWVESIRAKLPELPEKLRLRLQDQYGLSKEDADTMINEPGCVLLFEQTANGRDAKRVAAWITSEVFGQLSYRAQRLADSPLTSALLGGIVDALTEGKVTSAQAKQLLIELMDGEKRSIQELIEAHGWVILDDQAKICAIVKDILDAHPKEVAGYLKGQTRRLNFFVGKAMAATKGQARPQDVSRIVKEMLDSIDK